MSKTTAAYYLRPFMSWSVLLRVLADVILINASIFGASFLRFVWAFLSDETKRPTLRLFLVEFGTLLARSTWLITPICIITLAAFGVYTHTRAYRGRYKAVAMGQAVTLAYLLFGGHQFLFLHRAYFGAQRAGHVHVAQHF